jgi:hypothetical protein
MVEQQKEVRKLWKLPKIVDNLQVQTLQLLTQERAVQRLYSSINWLIGFCVIVAGKANRGFVHAPATKQIVHV